MRGSVKSGWPGVLEQLRNENRSGGLGKSCKEVSEFTVDEDEGSRERFRSKYGSGSSVGPGGWQISVWTCAAGVADTQEEAEARYVGAGPLLPEQAERPVGDVEALMVGVTGEMKVGKEGEGGS